jgi:NADH-quinone oxidoreductase subunit N
MSTALLAPLILTLGMAVVLVADLVRPSPTRSYRLSLLTLALAFCGGMVDLSGPGGEVWGPLDTVLAFDTSAGIFSSLAIFLAFLACGISWSSFAEEQQSSGEYYSLLLAATLGAVVVAEAEELITFFIAFELLSIPLYMLAGFRRYHRKSAEAGLKYFLSGAVSSALFLFGASWIYGSTGSTTYAAMAAGFSVHDQPMVLGLLMVLAAFAFKISAAPFHMWAPDTYEGAPIPVAAYLSTVPKVVMFAALLRLCTSAGTLIESDLMMVLSGLSVLSVMVGNLVALTQREMTRLAAYSGVAQIGYVLIGASAMLGAFGKGNAELAVASMGALFFYLAVYAVTNLAFWLVVLTVSRARGSTDLDAFDGLSENSPFLALAMLVCCFSLAGVPPLAGFVGKLYLFRAALYVQPLMAVFGVLGSVMSLYYYFGILRRCYFLKPPAEARPIELAGTTKGLLGALLLLTLVGGLVPQVSALFMTLAQRMLIP